MRDLAGRQGRPWDLDHRPDRHVTGTVHRGQNGLELGADMIKVKYNGDIGNFKWMLKCAGRCKIVISGGDKKDPAKQPSRDLKLEALARALRGGRTGTVGLLLGSLADFWHQTLAHAVQRELRGHGLRVVRNKPYAGGFITEHYGNPGAGFHAVQIEINRALYWMSRHWSDAQISEISPVTSPISRHALWLWLMI